MVLCKGSHNHPEWSCWSFWCWAIIFCQGIWGGRDSLLEGEWKCEETRALRTKRRRWEGRWPCTSRLWTRQTLQRKNIPCRSSWSFHEMQRSCFEQGGSGKSCWCKILRRCSRWWRHHSQKCSFLSSIYQLPGKSPWKWCLWMQSSIPEQLSAIRIGT